MKKVRNLVIGSTVLVTSMYITYKLFKQHDKKIIIRKVEKINEDNDIVKINPSKRKYFTLNRKKIV